MDIRGTNLQGINIIDQYRVPNAPTIGIASVASATSATVSFTAPTFNGNQPITSYTAVSTPGNITATVTQSGSGTITVTGLTSGTSYTFTVYATNLIGNSASSAASNSLTIAVEPNAPTIGTPTIASGTSINVPFTAPADNGGSTITSYTAISTPGNITATVTQSGSGTITVTGLTKGTSYTFVVYATNAIGNSNNSSSSTAIVPSTVPGAPTIGTATLETSSSASITFTAPADNGGVAITSYTAISTPGGLTGTLNQAGSGAITVTGLSAGTSYTFVVYATNARGNSNNSAASNSITTSIDSYYSSVKLQLLGEGTLNSTTITDTSSSAWTIPAVTGITISNAVTAKQGSTVIRFAQGAGSGKYLTTPTNSAFNVGTSGFTFEAWVYCFASTSGFYPLFQGSDFPSASNSLYIGLYRNTALPSFDGAVQVQAGGSAQYLATAYTSWTPNTWFHVAVTAESGTGIVKIWLNGEMKGSGPTTWTTFSSTAYQIGGGIYTGTSYGYASSYVDFLRFTPGVVRYTNTFTPPLVAGP